MTDYYRVALTALTTPNDDGTMTIHDYGRALWRLDGEPIEDMPQGEYVMVPVSQVVNYAAIAEAMRKRFPQGPHPRETEDDGTPTELHEV